MKKAEFRKQLFEKKIDWLKLFIWILCVCVRLCDIERQLSDYTDWTLWEGNNREKKVERWSRAVVYRTPADILGVYWRKGAVLRTRLASISREFYSFSKVFGIVKIADLLLWLERNVSRFLLSRIWCRLTIKSSVRNAYDNVCSVSATEHVFQRWFGVSKISIPVHLNTSIYIRALNHSLTQTYIYIYRFDLYTFLCTAYKARRSGWLNVIFFIRFTVTVYYSRYFHAVATWFNAFSHLLHRSKSIFVCILNSVNNIYHMTPFAPHKLNTTINVRRHFFLYQHKHRE